MRTHRTVVLATILSLFCLPTAPGHCDDSHKVQKLLADARAHHKMMEDDLALPLYTQVLELQPNNGEARLERAEAYKRENRVKESIADYKYLISSKNSEHAVAGYINLGKVYQSKKQFKEAISCFEAARKMGTPYLLTELSDCSRDAGDYHGALQYSEELIKSGQILNGRNHRALALMGLGQREKALEDYDYLVKEQRKMMTKIDRESRAIYTETNHLLTYLAGRARCLEELKKDSQALQDRAAISKIEKEFFSESPFVTKEKHFQGKQP